MKVRDVHLNNPAKVILYGKGRKLREVPILPNIALHLQQYLAEHKLHPWKSWTGIYLSTDREIRSPVQERPICWISM